MAGSPIQLAERDGLPYRDQFRLPGADPSSDPYQRELDRSSFSSEDVSSSASFSSATNVDYAAAAARINRRAMTNPLFPANDCVAELRPEEVRWFYQEEGEKKWLPFDGYDSLRLECKHRELLCTAAAAAAAAASSAELPASSESGAASRSGGGGDSQGEKILVRGGLFEADIAARSCRPIYWSGVKQTAVITRGTWFRDNSWQPLPEDLAAKIESEHLAKFEGLRYEELPCCRESGVSPGGSGSGGGGGSGNKSKEAIHSLRLTDCHVNWYDLRQVHLYQDSTSRFILQKLGVQRTGTRLARGYKDEAKVEEKLADITHLVFVIHGIGQKMRTGAIVKCAFDLRQTCERIKRKFFPDLDSANQRVEFLPVEWRSALTLDGDTVDSITPPNIRGLRTLLNSSAMDVLYYTSPLYRAEITHGLQTELSRLYSMFCARHPYFESAGGKVSVIGHSLGCVITYDIVMGWNPMQLYDQFVHSYLNEKANDVEQCQQVLRELEEARKKVTELEYSLLSMAEKQHKNANSCANFRLENLFCLGSPLAVFLALRGIRPKGNGTQEDIVPKSIVNRIYNIYHPADPVAYRLEPLILKHYSTIQPVLIHRVDALNKPPYHTLPQEPLQHHQAAASASSSSASPSSRRQQQEQQQLQQQQSQQKLAAAQQFLVQSTGDASPPELNFDELSSRHSDAGVVGACCAVVSGEALLESSALDIADVAASGDKPSISSANLPTLRAVASDASLSDRFNTFLSRFTSKSHRDSRTQQALSGQSSDSTTCSPSRTVGFRKIASASGSVASSSSALSASSGPVMSELKTFASNYVDEDAELFDAPTAAATSSAEESSSTPRPPVNVYDSMHHRTELEHRLDYQLREGRYESSYVSVLTSHTAYWSHEDIALFIMTHLFPDYGPIGIPKR